MIYKFIAAVLVAAAFGFTSCSGGGGSGDSGNGSGAAFALSKYEGNSPDVTVSKSNDTYIIRNTNNTQADNASFVLSNAKTGPLYIFFKIKAIGSNKRVGMKVRTNQENPATLKSFSSYIGKLDLDVTTTEKEHKMLFYIDDADHREGIELLYKIPEDSEIQISFTKIEGNYGPYYTQIHYSIWAQKDWLENEGYLFGEFLDENTIEYTFNISPEKKAAWEAWKISSRYVWTPNTTGTYNISFDFSFDGSNSRGLDCEIEENWGNMIKFGPYNAASTSHNIPIDINDSPEKERVIRFCIPEELLDDNEHKLKISNMNITKQ